MEQNYSNLDRPYDENLNREGDLSVTLGAAVGEDAQSLQSSSNGSVEDAPIKSEQSLKDLWIDTFIKSKNWKPKKFGFYLDGETGYAEFSDVYITGSITASTGTIGGFTVGADYIRDAANSMGLASTVSGSDDVRFWAGDTFANRATAPFRVTEAGAVTGSSITITGGSIIGTPIASIPNSTATDISLLDLTHDLVFSVTDKDTVAWATGTITLSNARTFTIDAGNTGNMAARSYIYLDTAVSSTVLQVTTSISTAMGANKKLIASAQNGSAQAQFTVYGGIGGLKLPSSGTSIANNNWNYSGTWSVTDADTIAWGAGTLTTSDGGSYSITGSNTGNMAAKTYIYFDLGTSSTAFQTTTTASTAVGDGKILIAIAQNGTGEANYLVVNDKQSNIDAAQIVAGSITANEIATGTITADRMNVSQLSAIAADLGTMTAGSISVVNGSNTVGFTPGGSNAIFSGPTGSPTFKVTPAGVLTATGATISGALTATSGAIGGWTINSTSIYTGVEDHSGYTANAGDLTIYSDGADASIHAKNFYIDSAGVLNCTAAVISGGITTTSGSSLDGQYLTAGSVASAAANLALRGWVQTCAFSVTDADTIAWGSGTFTASDGTAYSIGAGNTGNMAAKTYVYLDIAVSTTAYQTTTTAATATGNGKVLVAICQNATGEAKFMLLNDNSYNIDAANIVAGSITANEIAVSTISADRMSVSQLSAIAADLGTITAGSITINAGVASISSAGAAVFKSIQVGGSSTQYTLNDSGIYSFGDGSDGAAVFNGTDAVTGATRVGSTYTLDRDVYYTDATISTGVTLKPNGYRLFGTGTLTLNGTATIQRNGNAGSNGTDGNSTDPGTGGAGGAALADGYLKGSVAGVTGGTGGLKSGGNGVNGATGTATSNSIGVSGVAGGTGGTGGTGSGSGPGTGGTSAGGTATTSNVKLIANWHLATLLDVAASGSTVKFDNSAGSGAGGGGGGGSTAGTGQDGGAGGGGGGSGSSGGIIAIYFKTIVIGASASITATGGVGGNGGAGGSGNAGGTETGGGGGGAGGAGGNGGQIILVYNALTNNGALTVTGGAGGTGGSGGVGAGTPTGGTGATGATGTTGTSGTTRQFNLSL